MPRRDDFRVLSLDDFADGWPRNDSSKTQPSGEITEMTCRRLIFVLFVMFVMAMFLHGFCCESMADDCPTLDVGKYKQRLLSLQSEYADFVSKVGKENLQCNEVIVGKILDGVIERIEYMDTINIILSSFCSVASSHNYRDVWKEVVDIVNGDLNIIHAENTRYLQLIAI